MTKRFREDDERQTTLEARRIAGQLRDEILASKLAPGSEMRETLHQLQARFGVGPKMMRSALAILGQWGVIDLIEGRGMRSRIAGGGDLPPSEAEVIDHVRQWLEGKAPGTPVPRQQLAGEVGVGIWRIDHAIDVLVADGAIDRSRGGTSPATVAGAPARVKADDVRQTILTWIASHPGAEQIPALRYVRQLAGNANQKAAAEAVKSLIEDGVLRRGLPRQPMRIVYPQPDLSARTTAEPTGHAEPPSPSRALDGPGGEHNPGEQPEPGGAAGTGRVPPRPSSPGSDPGTAPGLTVEEAMVRLFGADYETPRTLPLDGRGV